MDQVMEENVQAKFEERLAYDRRRFDDSLFEIREKPVRHLSI